MHWFKKCNFWKNSLSHFRGRRGQEVIFEVAEAKFWISSSFNKFWFRIFVILDFEVVWPRQPQRPQKCLCQIFQKLHQIAAFFFFFNMTYILLGGFEKNPNVSSRHVWGTIIINSVTLFWFQRKWRHFERNEIRVTGFLKWTDFS